MKKYLLFLLLIVVVLVSGCVSYGNQQPPSNQPPSSGTNIITIKDFAFSPAALTVKAGTTVTWTNHDSVSHSIKSDGFNSGMSDEFNSDILKTGDSFNLIFTNVGTYAYICGIHPSMKGTVIVE